MSTAQEASMPENAKEKEETETGIVAEKEVVGVTEKGKDKDMEKENLEEQEKAQQRKRALEETEKEAEAKEQQLAKKVKDVAVPVAAPPPAPVAVVESAAAEENETQHSSTTEEAPESQTQSQDTVEKDSTEAKEEPVKKASSSWLGAGVGFGSFVAKGGASAFGDISKSTNVFEAAKAEPVAVFGQPSKEEGSEKQSMVFGEKSADENGKTSEEEIPTGEENELCIHQVRVRLFRLSEVVVTVDKVETEKLQLGEAEQTKTSSPAANTSGETAKAQKKLQWTEMGAGFIRVNKPKNKAKGEMNPRLVMRREGVLKLLLNAPIWHSMPVEKASDKAIRVICTSHTEATQEPLKPESFLLRLPRKDQCEELLRAILSVRNSIQKPPA